MIFYFSKKTGRCIGLIHGRLHSDEEKAGIKILPNDHTPEDVDKKIIEWVEVERVKVPGHKNKQAIWWPEFENAEIPYKIEDGAWEPKNFVLKNGRIVYEPEEAPAENKTVVIDLAKTLEDIWAGLSDTAKSSIRTAEKAGLTFSVESYKSLSLFRDIMIDLAQRKAVPLSLETVMDEKYFFKGLRTLFLVRGVGASEVLAGALVQDRGLRLVYLLAATTEKGRKSFASYFLVWNLIKEAKALGYKAFDFGGVYDPFTSGVTQAELKVNIFKNHWGGKEVGVLALNKIISDKDLFAILNS